MNGIHEDVFQDLDMFFKLITVSLRCSRRSAFIKRENRLNVISNAIL